MLAHRRSRAHRGPLAALLSVATLLAVALPARADAASGTGNDISWPQCASHGSSSAGTLPANPAFGIVGATNGAEYTRNPCLTNEFAWAQGAPAAPQLYLFVGNPGPGTGPRGSRWAQTSPVDPAARVRPCSGAESDDGCAYDYGYGSGLNALYNVACDGEYPGITGGVCLPRTAVTWWLDIEPVSGFRTDADRRHQNVVAMQGTVDALRAHPDRVAGVGVYASPGEWRAITGGDATTLAGLPYWYPVGSDGQAVAQAHCGQASPAGGPVQVVQWTYQDDTAGRTFDGDALCPHVTVVPPTILSLTDKVLTGQLVTVRGYAPAGQPVTLSAKGYATAELPVATVTPDSSGQWSASYRAMTSGYVTVRGSGGAASRAVQVTGKVAVTASKPLGLNRRSPGSCLEQVSGTASPYLPGQRVSVLLANRRALVSTATHRGPRVAGGYDAKWSATVSLPCGRSTPVHPVLPGTIQGKRFAVDTVGAAKAVRAH